ncbi:hypothetical protein [Paraburkholderia xenovorans]
MDQGIIRICYAARFFDWSAKQNETERNPTKPNETDLIFTARALIEDHEPKMAMFKLHEVINGRLEHT